MPRYAAGSDEPAVSLTDHEKTLVRASIKGNIAALHFDGQVLIDLLTARRELENRERRA